MKGKSREAPDGTGHDLHQLLGPGILDEGVYSPDHLGLGEGGPHIVFFRYSLILLLEAWCPKFVHSEGGCSSA